jgi:hypothetical protein
VNKYVCHVRFVIFVFPRFHVWNPGFLFLESAFFFIRLSRPQDCDLELQTVSLAELPQHPGKFLRKWAGLPRGTLLIGQHCFEAHSACHVTKIDMCITDWSTWHHLQRVKRSSVRTIFDACRSGHVAATW